MILEIEMLDLKFIAGLLVVFADGLSTNKPVTKILTTNVKNQRNIHSETSEILSCLSRRTSWSEAKPLQVVLGQIFEGSLTMT